MRAREDARREKKRIEREAQRRREVADQKESKRSLRGNAKHDADARFKKRAAIVSGTDGIAAKQAGVMESRLGRLEDELAAKRVEKRYDADIWLEATPSRRLCLCAWRHASFPWASAPSRCRRSTSRETTTSGLWAITDAARPRS
jgi:hypothetical protein